MSDSILAYDPTGRRHLSLASRHGAISRRIGRRLRTCECYLGKSHRSLSHCRRASGALLHDKLSLAGEPVDVHPLDHHIPLRLAVWRRRFKKPRAESMQVIGGAKQNGVSTGR